MNFPQELLTSGECESLISVHLNAAQCSAASNVPPWLICRPCTGRQGPGEPCRCAPCACPGVAQEAPACVPAAEAQAMECLALHGRSGAVALRYTRLHHRLFHSHGPLTAFALFSIHSLHSIDCHRETGDVATPKTVVLKLKMHPNHLSGVCVCNPSPTYACLFFFPT